MARESGSKIPTDAGQIVLFLAIALGIAMPLVEAALYPTYFVMMEREWAEFTRLIELPYVVFEVLFILWAGNNGFDLMQSLRRLPRDILVAAGVLLVAALGSSLIISSDKPYAMTHSLMWLVHLVFALAVVSVLATVRECKPTQFLRWHVVGLVVLSIYTAWWFLTIPPVETLPFEEVRLRGAVPGWIDVRHFGSWTGAVGAAFAVRILFAPQNANLKWDCACYFLAAGLTVWSGTRAAILAITFVTLVFVLIFRSWPDWRRIGIAALLTLFACGVAYLLLPDDPVFHLFTERELAGDTDLTRTRWVMWSRSLEIWLQSPLLGLGTGSIFWEYDPIITPTQPHNVILQFLISWGIVGATAGLWILVRAIHAVHTASRSMPVMFGVVAMLYALLFQSLLEGMLHYPRFIVTIMVLGAMVIAAGKPMASARAAADGVQ